MDAIDKWKIALGVFYVITAIVLILVAYYFFIKKYRKNKLVAMNSVSLITSRENIFRVKTRFLVVSPLPCRVRVDLLDEHEKMIKTLVDEEVTNEELPFDFDPADYNSGKYYLYLTADNARILRSITIVR